jgi:hypothetical protein
MSQMPPNKFSALELLDLPPLQRAIFLHIARHGPATVAELVGQTGHDAAAVQSTVDALIRDERLRVENDGRIDAVYGQVSRRTTIPAVLWPAIATDRPYTQQEIATLRTAIPILQFARARLSQFADHGPGHALRVRSFAVQLSYLISVTPAERHLLRIGALFHDVGNVVERKTHHIISQETVAKLAAEGKIPFKAEEATVVGLLCRWHRGEYDPDRVDLVDGEPIRTGLLASVLRVADAMDIDHRRSDYDERFRKVLELFFADNLQYWTSLEEIAGVRIRAGQDVRIQVATLGPAPDNMQIAMLRRDLGSTPLPWSIEQVPVDHEPSGRQQPAPTIATNVEQKRTLIAFPFDAHSLVMAALSRNHLAAAGETIDLLCYPDAPDGTRWLWAEAIPNSDLSRYGRLVVIGDRPDPTVESDLVVEVGRWRSARHAVSVLNRYEANWSRLSRLNALGVDTTVGGDWAYFWGDAIAASDLTWGRIAALCTRDPTLAAGAIAPLEYAVARGLQTVVYDVLGKASLDTIEGWRARAEPILERIQVDDRTFFAGMATEFAERYLGSNALGRVDGRVIVFERPPGRVPQAFPSVLESAIEREGRAPERGMRFNAPHAIAAWPDGEAVEVLAVTHWKEEEALPIRLLYPDDTGPAPQGNEHALHVRIPADLAPVLVRTLIDACNRP